MWLLDFLSPMLVMGRESANTVQVHCLLHLHSSSPSLIIKFFSIPTKIRIGFVCQGTFVTYAPFLHVRRKDFACTLEKCCARSC